MAKKIKRAEYFKSDLFPFVFGLCLNEEQYVREMKSLHVDNHEQWGSVSQHACVHTFINEYSKQEIALVCINLDRIVQDEIDEITVVGICAHEAVHVFNVFIEFIKEKSPGEELQAYFIQWVTCILLTAVKKTLENQTKAVEETKDE